MICLRSHGASRPGHKAEPLTSETQLFLWCHMPPSARWHELAGVDEGSGPCTGHTPHPLGLPVYSVIAAGTPWKQLASLHCVSFPAQAPTAPPP